MLNIIETNTINGELYKDIIIENLIEWIQNILHNNNNEIQMNIISTISITLFLVI